MSQVLCNAGISFNDNFMERDVGYTQMLAMQNELWPSGTPKVPQCWNASDGLGNAMHIDRDVSCSFTFWGRTLNMVLCLSGGFFFPSIVLL